jgi:hypothetical protein
MAKDITWKFEGGREVEAVLVQLPRAVSKRTARQSQIEALEPIADTMRAKAPRLTGGTAKSVNVGTALSRSQKRFAGFAGGSRDADTQVVYAGPDARPQALLSEIGSVNNAPVPYVRPAWDGAAGGLLERFAGIFGPRVMAAFERASKKGKLR